MSIQLQRKHGAPLAQNLQIRNHQLRTDVSGAEGGAISDAEFAQLVAVAEKCPVHKLMTSVTTEITTTVQRAA